jgi:hypothetical protein
MDELAIEHMKIRAAHIASRDLDEDLLAPWHRDRQLHLAEWLARLVEHHRLHRRWWHYNILCSESRRLPVRQLKRCEVPEQTRVHSQLERTKARRKCRAGGLQRSSPTHYSPRESRSDYREEVSLRPAS